MKNTYSSKWDREYSGKWGWIVGGGERKKKMKKKKGRERKKERKKERWMPAYSTVCRVETA